jgi:predicted nucleotidyltransferase
MKAREGELVESADSNIFDVKGLVHPPDKIIAFIRFTPDPSGERERNGVNYNKVYPLQERYSLLRQKFTEYLTFDPVFDEWLCEVPSRLIKRHYMPVNFLNQLRNERSLGQLENQSLQLAQSLQGSSNVDWDALGVSGSLLVGLNTPNSDIDLIVYGSRNGEKVHNSLNSLVKEEDSHLNSYGVQDLRNLFDFRSKDTTMNFEDFVRTETRKVLQGKFLGRDYFIRCVKDWREVTERYGDIHYQAVGEGKIQATIIDDSQMIFTPCTYEVGNVKAFGDIRARDVQEIVSFRGRFCEQARRGEKVVARGKVELVNKTGEKEYLRLLIGNKLTDFMYRCENMKTASN